MAGTTTTVFPQDLAPLVVDLDYGGVRYVDSILWPVAGAPALSPSAFAAATCADLDLPEAMGRALAAAIDAQVLHARAVAAHVAARDAAGKRLLPRVVVVAVDVTDGGKRFCDEFRWDTRNARDVPEELARLTCRDMALGPPFDAAVAFAIRRELARRAAPDRSNPRDARDAPPHP